MVVAGIVTVGPSIVTVDPVSVTITVEVVMIGPPGKVGQLALPLIVTVAVSVSVSAAGQVALRVTVVGAQELLVVLALVEVVAAEVVVVLSVV